MAQQSAPNQFGQQQWLFIKKVRTKIEEDPKHYFDDKNWRCISPTYGRNDSGILLPGSRKTSKVDAFYVKSVAVWIPHLPT